MPKAARGTRGKVASEARTGASAEQYPAYILRTCDADMGSYGGFVWPAHGHVACPDWAPQAHCGNGLHGFLWGEGDGGLASWNSDAKWLVAGIREWVDLGGKVKFPEAWVVFCGDRAGAAAHIQQLGAAGAVIGGTATAGDSGTATAGDRGTILCKFYDRKADRWRYAIGYSGEAGIKANVAYRADDAGNLVVAE